MEYLQKTMWHFAEEDIQMEDKQWKDVQHN